ncbi:MAG: response regulator [Chloroflexales bacterium]|nr:response regulator [Chloroflexales bacterium]
MNQRIVLVEAAVGFGGHLQGLLTYAGYCVEHVTSGTEALALSHALPPDLVILDIDLFDRNGMQVARELRATCPAPLLLLVPNRAVLAAATELTARHVDSMTKPFAFELLLNRVRHQLGSMPTMRART